MVLLPPVGSIESEIQDQIDASSDLSAIFTDNGSESEFNSDSEPESEDSDDENDSRDDSYTDEGQRPPEHYLAEAEGLDVSQLRQKRYSDKTQEKLDETVMHWNR